jgi:hypothetical protein
MNFMVNIDLKKLPTSINYTDRILLMGSCFTEHIGNTLQELKFKVMQNPNGILFDPESVCQSLIDYIENRQYTKDDFFQLNEVWHSWSHHSRFSNTNIDEAVALVNSRSTAAHEFLKKADWVVITLGSAFSYRLSSEGIPTAVHKVNAGVANCHRAPSQWFHKHLLQIDQIHSMLDTCYHRLMKFNPNLNILFTVSPVRHIRDGVIENNRSKARLIEAVHHMVNKFDRVHYFAAYELVIDVLRDYRFYDVDLAHPNYLATEFVLEKFGETCISESDRELMQEVRKIIIARKHRAMQPNTGAHRQFMLSHYEKTKSLQQRHSFLDLKEELEYFDTGS